MAAEYMPGVRARFPDPTAGPHDPAALTPSQRVHASYHHWNPDLPELWTELYPSHLHIDIVQRGQVWMYWILLMVMRRSDLLWGVRLLRICRCVRSCT